MSGQPNPGPDPIYLLDVSLLLALLWQTHTEHVRATQWAGQKKLAVCPLTELGFLRISTQPAFGLTVEQARTMLDTWIKARTPAFIACDARSLETDAPPNGKQTTDFYLASLANKHGMGFATLDAGIKHHAALLI